LRKAQTGIDPGGGCDQRRADLEKIWLKSYPPGIPAEIDYGVYRSVGDLFEKSCAKFRDRPAYHSMGRTLVFGELEHLAAAFGAWLQSQRLPRGARVAVMMPNCLQYPVCAFGALRAGYTVVNVNPLYTARELEHQLKDSGAEAIVILENFAHVLDEVLARTALKHVVVTALGDLLGFKGAIVNFVVRHVKRMVPKFRLPGARRFNDVIDEGRLLELRKLNIGHEDVAFLQYTGGTTGVAKGATLLHRNLLANVEQAAAWVKPVVGNAPQVIITALPLYHIFSLSANCMLLLRGGGCNVLITNPRDIPGFIRELGRHRFTMFTGVNTLFNALLNHPAFAKLDFSALKITLGGGMAVQKAVAERWKQVTGCTLIGAYGLSETSPAVTINPLDLKEFNGAIGLPVPSTEISLRDDSGAEVPIGQPGELCVRGPQVMRDYWNSPAETAKVLGADGFLATGDIAVMDDRGFFTIVDRKKDMIKVSGFNVYPNEIEDVVAMHPGVLECAAVGVPDEHSGEVLKLFVVKKDPALSEDQLRAYCHDNLTGYKRPKYIEFRKDLPKSNVGKILRRALRDPDGK
jgi:long-chain acyl-CoA synthetase